MLLSSEVSMPSFGSAQIWHPGRTPSSSPPGEALGLRSLLGGSALALLPTQCFSAAAQG